MISQALIHPETDLQTQAALGRLNELKLTKNHPDVLWLDSDQESLGVEAVKKITSHFLLKPYSAPGRAVVVIGAEKLTPDAQNALLKTLEEPPESAVLILAAVTENSFLPTILSRCQIEQITNAKLQITNEETPEEVEKILAANLEERFVMVEKTEDKEGLLNELLHYFHQKLQKDPGSVEAAKLLLQAEQWQKANVNIRGILEYLMTAV
jgi:DNA polymerase III subunit delta'